MTNIKILKGLLLLSILVASSFLFVAPVAADNTPPTNYQAVVNADYTVTFTWDPVTGAEQYQVQWDPDGAAPYAYAPMVTGTSFTTNISLTCDTTLIWRIRTFDNELVPKAGDWTPVQYTYIPCAPQDANICGMKFYDANADGVKDASEVGIEGWLIELKMWDQTVNEGAGGWVTVGDELTAADGTFCFTVEYAGLYQVWEVMPVGNWVQTYPTAGYYEVTVELGTDYEDNDFGNYCYENTNGKTIGFWSNKNGAKIITEGTLWTYLTSPYYNSPTLGTAANIKAYLLGANAVDMGYMLSAQLIAAQLNVAAGFIDPADKVLVDGELMAIGDIIQGGIDALDGDRAEQECAKNLLDRLNNNNYVIVCPEPCAVCYL
jgi:hypothetical protein